MTVQSATHPVLEGKSKILRPAEQPDTFRVTFKDAATAFNGKKFAEIPGKGALNARISSILFSLLNRYGLPTCFVGQGASENELLYRSLKMIPLEVVVRNIALGSLCKRFGIEEGKPLNQPLIEFFLKDDAANDPQITDEMIAELGLLPSEVSLDRLKELAFAINEIFVAYFTTLGIRCADFKIEFGLDAQNALAIGDELSPDNFRLRDAQTGQVLDKDVFRLELADLVTTYNQLLERMNGLPADADLSFGGPWAYQAQVFVKSRKNVLSPESKAIFDALKTLGYDDVTHLNAGRYFEVNLTACCQVEAEKQLTAMTESLLANPVIEDFRWSIRRTGKGA